MTNADTAADHRRDVVVLVEEDLVVAQPGETDSRRDVGVGRALAQAVLIVAGELEHGRRAWTRRDPHESGVEEDLRAGVMGRQSNPDSRRAKNCPQALR